MNMEKGVLKEMEYTKFVMYCTVEYEIREDKRRKNN